MTECICECCMKRFNVKPSHIARGEGRYCSINCRKNDWKGKKHHAWKGGRFVSSRGYILILLPEHPFCNSNGYIGEHRLIMEKYLGRYLSFEEKVHHLDGNKQNNSIDNLHLFASVSDHRTYHHVLINSVKEALQDV